MEKKTTTKEMTLTTYAAVDDPGYHPGRCPVCGLDYDTDDCGNPYCCNCGFDPLVDDHLGYLEDLGEDYIPDGKLIAGAAGMLLEMES